MKIHFEFRISNFEFSSALPACCGHACHLSVVLGVSATAEKGVIRPSPHRSEFRQRKKPVAHSYSLRRVRPSKKNRPNPLKILHFYKFLTTILTANSSKTRAKKAIKKEPLSARNLSRKNPRSNRGFFKMGDIYQKPLMGRSSLSSPFVILRITT